MWTLGILYKGPEYKLYIYSVAFLFSCKDAVNNIFQVFKFIAESLLNIVFAYASFCWFSPEGSLPPALCLLVSAHLYSLCLHKGSLEGKGNAKMENILLDLEAMDKMDSVENKFGIRSLMIKSNPYRPEPWIRISCLRPNSAHWREQPFQEEGT